MGNKGSFYFGWYIVLAASIIVFLTVGMRMGIGPFVNPIIEDLKITRTELSFVIAVGMIAYGLGMPLAGYLTKRYSTRTVLLAGLIIFCSSIVWSITAKELVSFLLSYGILLSIGLSFMSNISLAPIVSKWFVRQRGKVLFYLSTGAMAGIAIVTPLSTFLIDLFGWKETLGLYAGVFTVIILPVAIYIMRDDVPEGADGVKEGTVYRVKKTMDQAEITWKEAFKTRAYWQLIFGLFACGFGMNLMGTHAVPMLMDHHFDTTTASYGIGVIGIVAIFSTLFLASIADRFSRKNILVLVYFIRGLGILGLVYVVFNWQLYFVAITGGLVWAGSNAMTSALLSDLYGVRLLGILNGWAFFVHQIGGAISSFRGMGI